MTQARLEVAARQDAAPGMAEQLSKKIGRKLTVENIREEGFEALNFLREQGKCPVCQIGKVEYEPAVSCGTVFRCHHDPCSETYSRQEVGYKDRDPVLDRVMDEGIAFLTGYKVLGGRHDLEQRLKQGQE